MATVIAGDADLADQAIADAVQATAPTFIFREFLRASVWRAVACAAADATRDLIAASAKHYYETGAEQFDRKLLTAAELSCMQKLPPSQLIGEFDPFARAVLVFC